MKTPSTSAKRSCLFIFLALGIANAAQADTLRFRASLSGDQEVVIADDVFVPGGVDTPATGRLTVRFDSSFTNAFVNLRLSDLVGTFAAAHFHCGRPGQNGPVAFGLIAPGMLEFDGSRVRGVLTNTDFSGGDCEAVIGRPVNNIAALAFAMRDGLIYINVHTDVFRPGEIRGQVLPRSGSE